MTLADKKVLNVLQEGVEDLPERCDGYRAEMRHLLADVLLIERNHQVARTRVVQNIADRVSATAEMLHGNRRSRGAS